MPPEGQTEASPPLIRLRGVRKSYGSTVVLEAVDLDVFAGEKVALIGGSGSGKSTLLRILMGLETIESGEVEIEGERMWTTARGGRRVPVSPSHLRRIRSKVGMVFQHFNLFPHMSVLRNVTEAPHRVLGLPREESRRRAA
jgi:polar amino acid transport system ATP-binding protein